MVQQNYQLQLYTEAQRVFYTLLSRKVLPGNFMKVFREDHDLTLDFLQAFLQLANREDAVAVWGISKALDNIRRRATGMAPMALRALFARMAERYQTTVSLQAFWLPFACFRGDVNQAARSWQALLNAVFIENMDSPENRGNSAFMVQQLACMMFCNASWDDLVSGAKAGNESARQVFRRAVGMIQHLLNPKVVFESRDSAAFDWTRDLQLMAKRFEKGIEAIESIPVPAPCVSFGNLVSSAVKAQCSEDVDQYVDLISWFGAYHADFQRTAESMWQEISGDPKYGLRPQGRDIVAIKIKAMHDYGYQSVQFIPRPQFPQTLARFWLKIEPVGAYHCINREISSAALEAYVHGHRYANARAEVQTFAKYSEQLENFIAIHCLWKIITGKIFKMAPKKTPAGEQERVRLKEELERSFLVRPHFRWLPVGFAATERALDRSVETFGYQPPSGKTFVKSDLVGTDELNLVSVREHRPVTTYTEEDLNFARQSLGEK